MLNKKNIIRCSEKKGNYRHGISPLLECRGFKDIGKMEVTDIGKRNDRWPMAYNVQAEPDILFLFFFAKNGRHKG